MALGALITVATAIQDKLSAHPELTWKALLPIAGAALAGWAKKWFADFSVDELPFNFGMQDPTVEPSQGDQPLPTTSE
jgi:hypothetical protein